MSTIALPHAWNSAPHEPESKETLPLQVHAADARSEYEVDTATKTDILLNPDTKYVCIRRHILLQAGCPRSLRQCQLDLWRNRGIKHEEWMAAYAVEFDEHNKFCMRLNHPRGRGCTHKPRCKYHHKCLLCGKQDHGAFMVDQNGHFVCDFHRQLVEEMSELSFVEEDLHELISVYHFFLFQQHASALWCPPEASDEASNEASNGQVRGDFEQ